MFVEISRLPDIPGHGKSLKNDELINIFKKNGAGVRVLGGPFQNLSNALANSPVFGTRKDVSSRRVEQV